MLPMMQAPCAMKVERIARRMDTVDETACKRTSCTSRVQRRGLVRAPRQPARLSNFGRKAYQDHHTTRAGKSTVSPPCCKRGVVKHHRANARAQQYWPEEARPSSSCSSRSRASRTATPWSQTMPSQMASWLKDVQGLSSQQPGSELEPSIWLDGAVE